MKQQQRIFFDDTPPTNEELQQMVSRSNPKSPFSKFVGNDKSLTKLQAAAFDALGKQNHMMRDLAFAIFGPASSGKTTVGRIYAETVKLPFVEVSPKSIGTVEDLFKEIARVLKAEDLELVAYSKEKWDYILPPMVVFIDEVHALKDSVVQGLLKATEYNDAVLVTESGKIISTHNVTWMIATTDEGKLFDAFRTRFSAINLEYLSKKDIAKIIKIANPDLDIEVCELVAHYNSRIPRKALEFVRYMRMFKKMDGGTWSEVAKKVAENEGIDQYGMHKIHLKILQALGQGPIPRQRISLVSGKKDEETEKYILPWLLTETDDQPALIHVNSKGYQITDAGLMELEKRGINYKMLAE